MNHSVKLSCEVDGQLAKLPEFFDRLEAWGRDCHIPHALATSVQLMLDELLTNVVMHAYQGGGGKIGVVLDYDAALNTLSATIRDHGPAFDPTTAPTPGDLQAPMEERRMGGLGIHFVQQLATRFTYRRIGLENETFVSRTLDKDANP